METAPTTDAVYQGVYALYNNPDKAEKEKASKWLDLLQKSVRTKLQFIFIKCDNFQETVHVNANKATFIFADSTHTFEYILIVFFLFVCFAIGFLSISYRYTHGV